MPGLITWIGTRQIGEFREDHQPDGSLFTFEYADRAASSDLVSLTMIPTPDQRQFSMRFFPPPFDMILPEGDRRARIESARKILPSDPFSLLSYVGANPVNRVRFLGASIDPYGDVPPLPAPPEIARCTQGKALFSRLLKDLDLRQGIAGVQPKILGLPASLPKLSPDARRYIGSTHILKSSTSQYPFLAVNEWICLEIFKAAGLTIPNTTLSADGELLLVERFDVMPDGSCLGFEEAAALMGETAATKYQRDYGSLIDSLSEFVPAQTEESLRRDMTHALILNYLLGNGDAHLKNFGLLYNDAGDARLAPFYDCVSTLAYIADDVPALALSFEWYSKEWWPRARLEEFAYRYGHLSRAEILLLIEASTFAISKGLRHVRRYAREIPAFAGLGKRLSTIWSKRIKAFDKR